MATIIPNSPLLRYYPSTPTIALPKQLKLCHQLFKSWQKNPKVRF
jgi:hypothetical protein